MSEARLNYWLEKVGSKGHWESHSSLSSVPIRLGQVVLSPSRFRCIYCLLPLACSAGVFFERAICSRKHYVEASRRERRWGESKGVGREKRKRCTFFLPSPLSFFRPRTYRKGYYFYSPQSSTVINQRWWLQQYYEHEQGFAHPKYVCTAGYTSFASSLCVAYVFRVTWPKRLCLAIPHRNALTEIAWEDAVQGLVNCRYKAASNRSTLLQTSPTTESDVGPLY